MSRRRSSSRSTSGSRLMSYSISCRGSRCSCSRRCSSGYCSSRVVVVVTVIAAVVVVIVVAVLAAVVVVVVLVVVLVEPE